MTSNDDVGSVKNLVRLFDPGILKRMDHLALLFTAKWPLSHIPELYEVFGKEHLIRFLDIFAGMTIHVPSRDSLERAVRDHCIYHDVVTGRRKPKVIARDYGISQDNVYKIVERMKAIYEELDQAIPIGGRDDEHGTEPRARPPG